MPATDAVTIFGGWSWTDAAAVAALALSMLNFLILTGVMRGIRTVTRVHDESRRTLRAELEKSARSRRAGFPDDGPSPLRPH